MLLDLICLPVSSTYSSVLITRFSHSGGMRLTNRGDRPPLAIKGAMTHVTGLYGLTATPFFAALQASDLAGAGKSRLELEPSRLPAQQLRLHAEVAAAEDLWSNA